MVLGVQGTLPGNWSSLGSHGTRSIILPGTCLPQGPIKLPERPREAERVEPGTWLGSWDQSCSSSSRVKQKNKGASIFNKCLRSWICVSSVI